MIAVCKQHSCEIESKRYINFKVRGGKEERPEKEAEVLTPSKEALRYGGRSHKRRKKRRIGETIRQLQSKRREGRTT